MSETAAMGITDPVMQQKKVYLHVPPDNDVRFVDLAEGVKDVEPGAPGEIIIKGPSVMKGYWNESRGNR